MSLSNEEIRSFVLGTPYDLFRLSRWKIQVRDHKIHSIDFGYVNLKESQRFHGDRNEAFYEKNQRFFTEIFSHLMEKHRFFTLELSLDGEGHLTYENHSFIGRFEYNSSEDFRKQNRYLVEYLPEIFQPGCAITFTSVNARARSLTYQIPLKNLISCTQPLPVGAREHNRSLLAHLHGQADTRKYFETLLQIDDERKIADINVKMVLHYSDLKRKG